MVSKALASLFSGPGLALSAIMFAAGAVLFIVSDLLLAVKNFSKYKKKGLKLHLIPYFLAILLIALSVIS
jgi:uncharacterized membrane protein YhhN